MNVWVRLRHLLQIFAWHLRGFRPTLFTPEEWDRQYKQGKWTSLRDLAEVCHNNIIVGYCNCTESPTILDVGCGPGALARMLARVPYTCYVGIDISSVAISEAESTLADEKTRFTVADGKNFLPDMLFDVIVFNECLYYFDEPDVVLKHYAQFLSPRGRMIVSIYENYRTRFVWSILKTVTVADDAVTITHHTKKKWTIKILSPLAI
jgi:2-polyprenyl-3-methyl-5-hydroxy-6-metoxy-1,4-benzoquinol methylase